MDEAEWLSCADPNPMLEFLRGKARERKLRLFACACYRRSAQYAFDFKSGDAGNHNLKVVDVEERYADGLASEQERHGYTLTTDDVHFGEKDAIFPAFDAVLSAAVAASDFPGLGPDEDEAERQMRSILSNLLRCVFGNPFHCSPLLPPAVLAWNDRTVPRIAEAIYEDRKMPEGTLDTARLAIFADALLDAGCEDEALMAHCREQGAHVRGCWAIDLILGKG